MSTFLPIKTISRPLYMDNTPPYYTLVLPSGEHLALSAIIDHNFPHRIAEAIEHIFRAGNKLGESKCAALESAIRSLLMEVAFLKSLDEGKP